MDLIFLAIGVFLIFDGLISYVLQREETIDFQIGRFVRSGIGIFIFLLGLYSQEWFWLTHLNL